MGAAAAEHAAGRRAVRAAGRARVDPLAWLALPAALYFVVAMAVPMVLLLGTSLRTPAGWGLGNFIDYLADAHNLGVVWNTVQYALLVTAASLVGGYAYAYAMVRVGRRMQAVLLTAIVVPMTASVIVKAFGWIVLLRSNGPINATLTGLGLLDQPARLLFTETGLIIGTTSILLPYMVLPLFSVLSQITPAQHEAAATLGATPVHRFLHVTLPLSLPGVIAGIGFVFSMAVSAYVIPSLLTGAGYKTLSKVAANAYLVILNPTQGAVASTLLLLIAGSAVAATGMILARRRR